MNPSRSKAGEQIVRILRRDTAAAVDPSGGIEQILAAAEANGVLWLVARALRSDTVTPPPATVSERLEVWTRKEQAAELARRAELSRTLAALHHANLRTLVFKGSALAYTHYPHPHLRPRIDTDLLVHERDRYRAIEALEQLGYERAVAVGRESIFTQASFYKRSVGGTTHVFDLHWKIANRPLFRDLFSFDELYGAAATIPSLGPDAKTFSPVHSLLVACIHPVAHHRCEWPLIWLYDIALIAERFAASEWSRFRHLARERKISVICRYAISGAAQCFDSTGWLKSSGMIEIPDQIVDEPSAAYLANDLNERADLMLDLKASRGAMPKLRLLLAHAFPDSRYMRATYAAAGPVSMTTAYVRRISAAVRRLAVTRSSEQPAAQ